MKKIWNDEQLIEAVKNSRKATDVIRKLGLTTFGRNYNTIKKHIQRLGLDTSHFMTKNEQLNEARSSQKKLTMEEIFTINTIDRKYIKSIIINNNLIDYKCQQCFITEWNGEKLSLHLDHINGINNDNRLENLRFLCPNCHSLTDSYCGKNVKGRMLFDYCITQNNVISKKNHNIKCLMCEISIGNSSKLCKKCAAKTNPATQEKIIWPPIEKIVLMVKNTNFYQTGKILGVSDNAIRKHFVKNGLDPKTIK